MNFSLIAKSAVNHFKLTALASGDFTTGFAEAAALTVLS